MKVFFFSHTILLSSVNIFQLISTKAVLENEKQKRQSLERDLEISAELLNVCNLLVFPFLY